MLTSSQPGYSFASADVQRASYDWHTLGVAILAAQQSDNPDDRIVGLLAAILKAQKKDNTRCSPVGFSYPVYTLQQVLSENYSRNSLLIQNVGGNDLMILLEPGPQAAQDYSASTNDLIVMQTRAIRIIAGGHYDPYTAPVNPITLFTLNGATNGVVIEGTMP